MSAIPMGATLNALSSYGASQTFYQHLAVSGYQGNATESNRKVRWQTGGVLSLLTTKILTNDRNTSTHRTRKNGANGSMAISITGSTTGFFSDSGNTDTVGNAASEDWNTQFVSGSGGTTLTTRTFGCLFAATTKSVARYCSGPSLFAVGGVTMVFPFAGTLPNGAAESTLKHPFAVAGTLKNGSVLIPANTRNGTTTFETRLNEATSGLSISVAASTSGTFEDTGNTLTIADGDFANWRFVTGGSSGGFGSGIQALAIDFETTNGMGVWLMYANQTFAVNTTRYAGFSGENSGPITTEGDSEFRALGAQTLSRLNVCVFSNSISSGTSSVTLRKNTADTSLTVSIPTTTTGRFEDSTHTASATATDTFDHKVITGTAGTSIVISQATVLWGDRSAGGIVAGLSGEVILRGVNRGVMRGAR